MVVGHDRAGAAVMWVLGHVTLRGLGASVVAGATPDAPELGGEPDAASDNRETQA
jgi:hypothetical protein